MPRGKGNAYYKPSRYTVFSGVTYTTQASGATIEKNSVQTTGVSMFASTVHSSYGYPWNNSTAGIKTVSGTTSIGGTSKKWTATALGLSTITNMIVSSSQGTAPVIVSLVKIDSTEVTAYMYSLAGATRMSKSSVNYFAVGT